MRTAHTWPQVERAAADQRAAFDRCQALHRQLCDDLAPLCGSRPPDNITGESLRTAQDALRRAERLLRIWLNTLTKIEEAVGRSHRSRNLVYVAMLLYGDTMTLDSGALRKEDRRPPAADSETRFGVGYVRENTESDLCLARRTVARIAELRRTAARLKNLMRAIDQGDPEPRATASASREGSPGISTLRARTVETVGLADGDPLSLRDADLAALERELVEARHTQISMLIDRLDAEENELRTRVIARESLGAVTDPSTALSEAHGLRRHLQALDSRFVCDPPPDLDAAHDELASIAAQTGRALRRVGAVRARVEPVGCVRPACTGGGVIEEDGSCSVCFLPPRGGDA